MTTTCVLFVTFRAELALLAADPTAGERQKSRSVGRYGATRGLDRVLGLLVDRRVPVTWLLPTAAVDLYPEQTARIAHAVQAGHDLGCLGPDLTDRTAQTLSEQATAVLEARAALAARLGVTPTGYRVSAGEPHPELAASLSGDGFSWSSCRRDDDRPYRHPSGLVEIPHHHELDDDAYFAFNLDPLLPAGGPRIAPVGDVYTNWQIEFDAYRAEELCFTLNLHTDLIGTPARAAMFAQLLDHIIQGGQAEFLTATQAAERCPPADPAQSLPADHPLSVFARGRAAHLRSPQEGHR